MSSIRVIITDSRMTSAIAIFYDEKKMMRLSSSQKVKMKEP